MGSEPTRGAASTGLPKAASAAVTELAEPAGAQAVLGGQRGTLSPHLPAGAGGAAANTPAAAARPLLGISCQGSRGTLRISLLGAAAKKKGKVTGNREERGQADCHLRHCQCSQEALSAAVLCGDTDRLGRWAASVAFGKPRSNKREKQSQGQPQGDLKQTNGLWVLSGSCLRRSSTDSPRENRQMCAGGLGCCLALEQHLALNGQGPAMPKLFQSGGKSSTLKTTPLP